MRRWRTCSRPRSSSSTATTPPEFSELGEGEHPRVRPAGGLPLRRRLLRRAAEFDAGFRQLIKEIFPERGVPAPALAAGAPGLAGPMDLLDPEQHPLWGIEHGCRTVAIYSPKDLSCYWNQTGALPEEPGGRQRDARSARTWSTTPPAGNARRQAGRARGPQLQGGPAKRGALRVAKLMHAGDWNIAPQAIPNLMDALRNKPSSSTWSEPEEPLPPRPQPHLLPADLHPRPRRPLLPQGGPGSPAEAPRARRRDALRRRGLRQPRLRRRLPPLRRRAAPRPHARADPPRRRAVHRQGRGFDLPSPSTPRPPVAARISPSSRGSRSTATGPSSIPSSTSAAPWNGIRGLDCKGYTYESAVRIAGNIVIYSTLP